MIKYALIGCGRIAPNHVVAARENNLEIVALCDMVERNAQMLGRKFDLPGEVHIYTDYRVMLEKESPDLVAIATESGSHARIALDCIEAGSNLIIEKPIALSIWEAARTRMKRCF